MNELKFRVLLPVCLFVTFGVCCESIKIINNSSVAITVNINDDERIIDAGNESGWFIDASSDGSTVVEIYINGKYYAKDRVFENSNLVHEITDEKLNINKDGNDKNNDSEKKIREKYYLQKGFYIFFIINPFTNMFGVGYFSRPGLMLVSNYLKETKAALSVSYFFYPFGTIFTILSPIFYYGMKSKESDITSEEYKDSFNGFIVFTVLEPSFVLIGYLINLIYGIIAVSTYMTDFDTYRNNYEFSFECNVQKNEMLAFVRFRL